MILNTRYWIQDTGYYRKGTGYRILDTGYWIQDTGYRILDTGYWIQDTGYRILDTGYWTEYRILDTGYWIRDSGYRILDTGYWIQDTGYRILDTGYWIQDTFFLQNTSRPSNPESIPILLQDTNTAYVTRFKILDSGVNHGSAGMDLIYSRIIHMKFIFILKYNLG